MASLRLGQTETATRMTPCCLHARSQVIAGASKEVRLSPKNVLSSIVQVF